MISIQFSLFKSSQIMNSKNNHHYFLKSLSLIFIIQSMTNTFSTENYRSQYDIEKLQDHNYHIWSFQCQILLSEKKIWKIVEDKVSRSKSIEEYIEEKQVAMNTTGKKNLEKIVVEWDEKMMKHFASSVSRSSNVSKAPYDMIKSSKMPGTNYKRLTLPEINNENIHYSDVSVDWIWKSTFLF